jgi:hypothetical protein
MVSVLATGTSLNSVGVDFVEKRGARELWRGKNEASTRSEAGYARKAVNKNRYSFGSTAEIRGQLWELRHRASRRLTTSSTHRRFMSASCRSTRSTT